MNVKELIEKLKEFDQESMVIVAGYEGGHDEITGCKPIGLRLNVNDSWYYGRHEESTDHDNCKVDCIAIEVL